MPLTSIKFNVLRNVLMLRLRVMERAVGVDMALGVSYLHESRDCFKTLMFQKQPRTSIQGRKCLVLLTTAKAHFFLPVT